MKSIKTNHRLPILKISASLIIFCIISACLLYLICTTWLKWGELVIDTSRELLTPYQLLNNKIIYKDIFYPYGFLPPYFFVFLYKVFGVHINTAVACGLVVTVTMAFLIYHISRFFMDEMLSGLTVITFLFVFAFGFYVGNGIFNYILPYSSASTFFMLFTAASLYFFLKYIFTEDDKNLIYWCAFMAFSFLSRPDYSTLTWIGFAASTLILIIKSRNQRTLRTVTLIVSPAVFSVLGYLLFLSINNAYADFKDSIINYILINYANPLNVVWFGINKSVTNSLYMLGSFSLHVIAVSILAFSGIVIQKTLNEEEYQNYAPMVMVLLAFLMFLMTDSYMNLFSQYRCLPLLLATGGIISFVRAIFSKNFKSDLAIFTLFLISLLTIARIFFNTTPYNYGFFLLNISLISYYTFFAVIFKDLLLNRFSIDTTAYQMAISVFFLLLIIPNWERSFAMYKYKNIMATTDRGSIACFNDSRTVRFWETANYLSLNTSKGDTVVVLPEGASLNFFSHRDSSSKYHTFLPPDVAAVGEDKMLKDLIRSNAKYIVIIKRDTTEYGYPAFGFDYAKKIYAWINKNYELVKQIGPFPNTSNEFGTAILRKKQE